MPADDAGVAFNAAGRNLRFVGLCFNHVLPRATAVRGDIALLRAFAFGRTIDFCTLCKVDFRAECAFNGLQIRRMTIARELNAIC
jgi:hypothetical protein